MKTWRNNSGLGVITSIIIGLAACVSRTGSAQTTPPAPPDSIVQVTAESKGLGLADPLDFIDGGTFWQMEPDGLSAPMPCPPQNQNLPVYQIANGQFLIDATGGQVTTNGETTPTIEAALAAQVESVVKLVDWLQGVEEIQNMKLLARAMGMNLPDFGDEGEGGGGTNSGGWTSSFVLDTNALYLSISNVVSGQANFDLHNGTNEVYAIWSRTNLVSDWLVETELWPTGDQTNVMPFTLPTWYRDKLFVRGQDWTGVDSNCDGVPDWWCWLYFGDQTLNATNLDGAGNTLLYEYTNNYVPIAFDFTGVSVTNNYCNAIPVPAQLQVTGYPFYVAVLVDDTNFDHAVWNKYSSSSVSLNPGVTEGWHEAWIGLRGHADEPAAAVWKWKRLKLDFTPPTLVITNPTASTGEVPLIQVQGFCPEALASISYDLTNALGLVTNLEAGVTHQYYDTNLCEFTTNYFECVAAELTNGLNIITLYATDLAGNVTTNDFSFTVDYTGKTNPPAVQLSWPLDGMRLVGNNFTVRGQVTDPTVSVLATITDTNGNSKTIEGMVELDGRFWVENLPLASGSNFVSLTISDVLTNSTVTNLWIVQSDLSLTINPVADESQLWQYAVTVDGTISDPSLVVWVNGMPGTNYGNGYWSAASVPITPGGVAIFDVTAYPTGEVPAAELSGLGSNPQKADAINVGKESDKPARLYVESDFQIDSGYFRRVKDAQSQIAGYVSFYRWLDQVGGTGIGIFNTVINNTSDNSVFSDADGCVSSYPAALSPFLQNGTIFDEDVATRFINEIPNSSNTITYLSYAPYPVCSESCVIKLNENGSINDPSSPNTDGAIRTEDLHNFYQRAAQTTWMLQTGGKSGSHRQNLFRIKASAGEDLPGDNTDSLRGKVWIKENPIAMEDVYVDFRPLGNDGYQWRMYADNSTHDVTPRVANKDFYSFKIEQQKYHPYIGLTTSTTNADLDTDTPEVCMGQKVTFAGVWDSAPGATSTDYIWNFSGKYVNHSSQANNHSSVNYDIDLSLLNTSQPYAWWYSGGDINAYLHEKLHFSNGQSVTVSASGQFNMFKPSVAMVDPHQHGTPTVIWERSWSLIPPGGAIQLGVQGGANNMSYLCRVTSSDFSGEAKITQICNIDASGLGGSYSGALDGGDPYSSAVDRLIPKNPNPTGNIGVLNLDDAPDANDLYVLRTISMNDSFIDYVRFNPDPSGDGIYVTLAKITWDVSASVTYANTNITQNSDKGPHGPNDSDEFPIWTTIK